MIAEGNVVSYYLYIQVTTTIKYKSLPIANLTNLLNIIFFQQHIG